jgi:hypothetical protein
MYVILASVEMSSQGDGPFLQGAIVVSHGSVTFGAKWSELLVEIGSGSTWDSPLSAA